MNPRTLARVSHVAGLAVSVAAGVFVVLWIGFIGQGMGFGTAIDDPKDFLIVMLNGITAAGLYFVVASGFTLIFGLMRVVNMAHGAFFLLGGYIALRAPARSRRTGRRVRPVLEPGQRRQLGRAGDRRHGARRDSSAWRCSRLFLRWNQGQDLRQALITIAVSIILADQMLSHFGGIAEDIAWPGRIDTSSTSAWRGSSTRGRAS